MGHSAAKFPGGRRQLISHSCTVVTLVVFLMAAITYALGVKLVRLGRSMENSLVQLSVVIILDLIP